MKFLMNLDPLIGMVVHFLLFVRREVKFDCVDFYYGVVWIGLFLVFRVFILDY